MSSHPQKRETGRSESSLEDAELLAVKMKRLQAREVTPLEARKDRKQSSFSAFGRFNPAHLELAP